MKFSKFPFGILAGLSGIFLFYDAVATFTLFIVMINVRAQTSATATLFDTWYQTLMFIFVILLSIIFIFSIIMYVLQRKKNKKKEKTNHENL